MLKKHVQKYMLASAVVLSAVALSQGRTASAATYLETDKNYYREAGISRGFLDQEISAATIGQENWDKFQVAVANNYVTYTPGMTFNQYYVANGISPEDNFQVYRGVGVGGSQDIKLPSGAYLNSNRNPKGFPGVDYITYVGPSDDRGAYWGDKELEDPVLFSRLTVGTPSFGVFPSGTWRFPTQIGYGEAATVNDYMLTAENDVRIPTRFNSKRSDLYLTMRSRGLFGAGVTGAQAYLTATSNGQAVQGSEQNQKFYIDTTSHIFMTEKGYDQLGTRSKLYVALGLYSAQDTDLKGKSISEFATKINQGLQNIQNASSVKTIVSGNGGQVQLTGFYRQSANDNVYTTAEADRVTDAVNNVDVTYYMYTTGADEGVTVTTPLAGNGQHLYSPNESVFKIETTRPYFTGFGDLTTELQSTAVLANFDGTLGAGTFGVTDNGIKADGEAVGVDLSRVRVRVSKNNGSTYEPTAYTLAELKAAFESKAFGTGKVTLAYTYAATDAQDAILGKLPSEIADNTGAYAIPFTRVVEITATTPPTTTGRYVKIDPTNARATKTDDGKAIFLIGNRFEEHFKDVSFAVYTDENRTVKKGDNDTVTWTIEPVAGFESRRRVIRASSTMMQYGSGATSTYTAGQDNVNRAKALVSGVYKVTVTLSNPDSSLPHQSDWAYLVVPGDTDRSGFISTTDVNEVLEYVSERDRSAFSIQDEFTMMLANVDLNRTVTVTDVNLLQDMLYDEVLSN